jgi:hypothetical protein
VGLALSVWQPSSTQYLAGVAVKALVDVKVVVCGVVLVVSVEVPVKVAVCDVVELSEVVCGVVELSEVVCGIVLVV